MRSNSHRTPEVSAAAWLPGSDAERPGSNQRIRIALAEDRRARQREFIEQVRHGAFRLHYDGLATGLNRNLTLLLP